MTPLHAKQILLAYRPWTNDAQDPEVAEALRICAQHAELADWLEGQAAAQHALRDAFRATPVPEGLRQQIIAESSVRTAPRWRRSSLVAAAAIVIIIVSIFSFWSNLPRLRPSEVNFAAYRNRMARTATRTDYAMDVESSDLAQIRAYLAQKRAPADFVLPGKVAQTQAVGGGVLAWQGRPVAMICFRTGKPLSPGVRSDLLLFVINRQDLAEPPPVGAPEFNTVGNLSTATWTEGGKVYLLAGFDAADLRQRM